MPGSELFIAFGFYLLIMFILGWQGWKRTHSHADYILGGRKLGPYTTAFSAGASDMSGWLLLGLPGLAYAIGLGSVWLAGGLLLGTLLNWHWVAPKLRQTSAQLNSLTIRSYLENRFNDQRGLLRNISALLILFFFLLYTSSGLVAGGKLFEAVFHIPYQQAVIAGTAVIVAYTAFGGFLAVSWTDVVQALLMAAALILVPLLALGQIQQQPELMKHAASRHDLLYFFFDEEGKPFTWIEIISLCAWGLGYFGQPHILARFKAIKNPKQLKAAKFTAVAWTFFTLAGAIATGILGAMYFTQGVSDGEKVFIHLVEALFNPWVAGVLLAAILAAIMSTIDSQLLVCSAAFSEDLYRPGAHKKHSATLARFSVVGIAVIAMAIALQPDSGVLDLVAYAWAGFGAAFGPIILFSLYWRRTTATGALAGIIAGALTVIVWRNLHGGLFDLYEIIPGFMVSCAFIFVASLTFPASTRLTTQS